VLKFISQFGSESFQFSPAFSTSTFTEQNEKSGDKDTFIPWKRVKWRKGDPLFAPAKKSVVDRSLFILNPQ